jgi:hypothetical protein
MSDWLPEGTHLRRWLLDVFVAFNLAFLALDIYLAHSVNEFANPLEWIPFFFSLAAPVFLVPGLLKREVDEGFSQVAGLVVGGLSIAVGVVGMFLHLESSFFAERTLRALTYTAPFAAPLSYAGVGFLLLLNRMDNEGWAEWVVFIATGGFIGNLALALLDHAQNGFFYKTEWISVFAAAVGVGFLGVAFFANKDENFLRATLGVMVFEVLVGLLGFGLHLNASLTGVGADLADKIVYGAPIFAPLLFANIAVLAGLGIWGMMADSQQAGEPSEA